jgi:hypothetical protein
LTYSAIVTNCGDIPLQNVRVVNSQPSPNAPVLEIPVLFPGTATNFTRSYTNFSNVCEPFVLTVTAQDALNQVINCPSSWVTNHFAVGACTLFCIRVAKTLAGYQLTCTTVADHSYTVQYADALTSPDWKVLTNFVANGPSTVVSDEGGPAHRFYRLVAH